MDRDILIIAHFTGDSELDTNNRFNYIARLLTTQGHRVELVTSEFSHIKKINRKRQEGTLDLKITYIAEPPYTKNVSLMRLFSHFIMSKNLGSYLRSRAKPDIVYCAVPSLDVAEVAVKYARINDVNLVIDIQDLWPEAFKVVRALRWLAAPLYWWWRIRADCIYRAANSLVAVSETYKNRAVLVNPGLQYGPVVYLGTNLERFDAIESADRDTECNDVLVVYVGTLGHSYDLTTVIKAIGTINRACEQRIKFLVMGDGPLKSQFRDCAIRNDVCCEFTGFLPYNEMVSRLKLCDIAVNPIVQGAAGSIINKHADYAAAGLPVVNTQESQEYRAMIETFDCGINCRCGDSSEVADAILRLVNDPELRQRMGENSRNLAKLKFDRAMTYQSIVKVIEENS